MTDTRAALAVTQALPFGLGSVLADRYELRALLGEGGMGTVFCAHDGELDEDVALKVLHAEAATDPAALSRFLREVKLARRVTHRNVARTFDLGVHEGLRFLTMELIVGQSLAAHFGRSRASLPETLRLAAEIARGLAAAHGAGVVHRDLKPENVMLSEDRVVITDFGIARAADGVADALRTGTIVGTPAYMAPEQLESRAVDGRTDVYALGTMLFELLTGGLPFQGDSAIAIAAQRLTADPPSVRHVDAALPESVASLVDDMLARRREDRPDAQTVLDRVEALRGNAPREGRTGPKLPSLSQESLTAWAQPRTVAVEKLAADQASAPLARMLEGAIEGGLTEARVGQVLLGGASADMAVQGSLHTSKERVRARLRLVEARKAAPVWAGHVDAAASDTLDLEDRVVEAVLEAVRARTARVPVPADPALREPYEQARAAFARFSLPDIRRGMTLLEDIEARAPGDPRVRGLLARMLIEAWAQMGARDAAMVSRAEELALRALAADPAVADALHVVALIRLASGELGAFLRAEEECLRQAPYYAEAHQTLGQLLCESLHLAEGRRRLDLAERLDPTQITIAFQRARVAALLGEVDTARQILRRARERAGPLSTAVLDSRLAIWLEDCEDAARIAEVVTQASAGAAWDGIAALMRAFVQGELPPMAGDMLAWTVQPDVAPRHRCMMHEIGAELYAALGEPERALSYVEAFTRIPQTDLLWMDRCPALASIRDDPRFAEARAAVAARVAELWS